MPYSLATGMASTLVGLLLLAHAGDYASILLAACLVGLGSAVFHPEASRVARLASGGRHGLAQSLFQVGGNAGSAIGPLPGMKPVIVDEQGAEVALAHARDEGLARIAVFDIVANNADRKGSHCLLGLDGRLWGIDHGLTFNHVPKLRTVIWDFQGDAMDEAHLADAEGLLQALAAGKLPEVAELLAGRKDARTALSELMVRPQRAEVG